MHLHSIADLQSDNSSFVRMANHVKLHESFLGYLWDGDGEPTTINFLWTQGL
jgi:hypothetical protein